MREGTEAATVIAGAGHLTHYWEITQEEVQTLRQWFGWQPWFGETERDIARGAMRAVEQVRGNVLEDGLGEILLLCQEDSIKTIRAEIVELSCSARSPSTFAEEKPMFGAIVGDIAGSAYERHNFRFEGCQIFADGSQFMDDTVLTLATADHFILGDSYRKAQQNDGAHGSQRVSFHWHFVSNGDTSRR